VRVLIVDDSHLVRFSVRALLDTDVTQLLQGLETFAGNAAERLLAASRGSSVIEWVGELAARLPTLVFMELMGIPEPDRWVVDAWTRAALRSHSKLTPPTERLAGATATMALRAYFFALARECPVKSTPWGTPTLVASMGKQTGCPVSASAMSPDEVMSTSVHLALGGYLSTEFLLATGVYNLLSQPDQWKLLVETAVHGPAAYEGLLTSAVWEMVRFDAPFQMADRWVATDTMLGGVIVPAASTVTLVYGSANHDPGPQGPHEPPRDRFDIQRSGAAANFGFGDGPHRCVGERIAVAVARAGLRALVAAFPKARISGSGDWSSDPYFRTLESLTLRVD